MHNAFPLSKVSIDAGLPNAQSKSIPSCWPAGFAMLVQIFASGAFACFLKGYIAYLAAVSPAKVACRF